MVIRSPGTAFGGSPSYGGNWGTGGGSSPSQGSGYTPTGGGGGGGSARSNDDRRTPATEQPTQTNNKSSSQYSDAYIKDLINRSGNRGKVTVDEVRGNVSAIRQMEKRASGQYSGSYQKAKDLLIETGNIDASKDPETVKAIANNPNALAQLRRRSRGYYGEIDLSNPDSMISDITGRQEIALKKSAEAEKVKIAEDIFSSMKSGGKVTFGFETQTLKDESGKVLSKAYTPYYSITDKTPLLPNTYETDVTAPTFLDKVNTRINEWETGRGGGIVGGTSKLFALTGGYIVRDVTQLGGFLKTKAVEYYKAPKNILTDVGNISKKMWLTTAVIIPSAIYRKETAYIKNPIKTAKKDLSSAYNFGRGLIVKIVSDPAKATAKGGAFVLESYGLTKALNFGGKALGFTSKVFSKNTFSALSRSKKATYGFKVTTPKKSLKQRRPTTKAQKSKIARGYAYNPNTAFDLNSNEFIIKGKRPAGERSSLRFGKNQITATLKGGLTRRARLKRVITFDLGTNERVIYLGTTKDFRTTPGFRKRYPKGYYSQNRLLPSGEIIIEQGQYIGVLKRPPKRLALPNKSLLDSRYNFLDSKGGVLISRTDKIIPATILKETRTGIKGFRVGTFDKLIGRLRNLKEQRLNILSKQNAIVPVKVVKASPYAYSGNVLDSISTGKFNVMKGFNLDVNPFASITKRKRKLGIFIEPPEFIRPALIGGRPSQYGSATGLTNINLGGRNVDVFNVGGRFMDFSTGIKTGFTSQLPNTDSLMGTGILKGFGFNSNFDKGFKLGFETSTRSTRIPLFDLGTNQNSLIDSLSAKDSATDVLTGSILDTGFSGVGSGNGRGFGGGKPPSLRITIPDIFEPTKPNVPRGRRIKTPRIPIEGIPEEPPKLKIGNFKLWETEKPKKKKKKRSNNIFGSLNIKFPTLEGSLTNFRGSYPKVVTGLEIRPIRI